MRKVYLLLFALLCINSISFAQLSGSKNIPGDYVDINAAVTALNAQGVGAGGVTFNVMAGHIENTTAVIAITATGTAANPIVFQKSGAGTNPVITRSDAGGFITTTLGAQGDAVIMIEGSDYITFDGIDVSASDMGIEYGYFLRKASVTDGCKNVTIKNAAITMTKGTSAYVVGIYTSNLDAASTVSSATGITVTSVGGRNENLMITGNTITNVFAGIMMRGYNHTTAPRDYMDQNNTIGAVGAGNTIQNIAGNATSTSYGVYGIYQNNWNVSYNTIQNTANGGSAATGIFYGIFASTGVESSFTATNNTIDLTTTASSLYGINNAFTGNLVMDFNTISLNTTALSTNTYGFLYNSSASAAINPISISNNDFGTSSLNASSGSTYLIYNNNSSSVVANITNNKTIGTITRTGATSGSTYGYYNNGSPTGTENINGNNFSNIAITASSSSTFIGINSTTSGAHIQNVFNNIITNISNTGGTGTSSGILLSTANTRSVYNNTIGSFSSGSSIIGINVGSGAANSGAVYNNKIYDISTSATGTTAGYVSGILVSSGTNNLVYNNLIGDLKAPSANAPEAIRAISITSSASSSTNGVYYNTIHLDAASSATNFGTAGIYHSTSTTATTAVLDLRNNIIVNNSTPNGTGKTVAFRRSSSSANTLNNYASTSNNNLFYAGVPGPNNVIFYAGSTTTFETAESLADYKAFNGTPGVIAPRDAASVSGNPPFLSINGADATFLHINTAVPTQVESGGSPITGITTDFDGNTRDASTPDIGADEGAFTISDISGPAIAYSLIANTGCLTAPTLSATITDASDVNVTAGTKPRLYFKRSTDNNAWVDNTNASNGWKYVEASNTSSPFTFTINYSLLNGGAGAAAGQTIEYFVVAQDLASPLNVAINSGIFNATPTSVNLAASAFPITGTINSYNIVGGINTNVTIGAAGTYPTLTGTGGLFEAINTNGLSANTVAEIIDATVTETGAVALNPVIYGCTANSTLIIKPAAGISPVLSGSTAASMALIKLAGVDNVIIDGSNNGTTTRDLTIQNTSTSANTAAIWVSSLGTGMGAENVTIKNTNIMAGSNTVTTVHGIYVGGTAITTSATGDDNDNLTIKNNSISKAYYGIYAQASATGVNNNLIISGNSIGSNTATDYIGQRPMLVSQTDGAMVNGNTIFNMIGCNRNVVILQVYISNS